MHAINPYLNFPGTTEEAFNFYKSIFGGDFPVIMRFKDTPEGSKMPADDANKIMHMSLPIKKNMLMATDALESMGQSLTVGNNFHLIISAESEEEADKLHSKLAEGGKITVPLAKASWGDYFGMVTDKFGIQWMISYDYQNRGQF